MQYGSVACIGDEGVAAIGLKATYRRACAGPQRGTAVGGATSQVTPLPA
jgi:hypothetical protein